MKARSVPYTWSPPREPVISLFRSANTSIDQVFYDTGSLTAEERSLLEDHDTPEGFVVVTYPSSAKQKVRILHTWEFVAEEKKAAKPIDAIAVAGVGSSAGSTRILTSSFMGAPIPPRCCTSSPRSARRSNC